MNIGLILEITRRCNVCCQHCLRGDAENLDMDFKYIDSILDQVDEISCVTFTGGEPSLNVPAMQYFLDRVKLKRISVDAFFLYTNGMHVSEEFVLTCLRLYAYCGDKGSCAVTLSNDYYHAVEGNPDTDLLKGLSFFREKYKEEFYNFDNGKTLISMGRAEEFGGKPLDINIPTTLEGFLEDEVYVNAKGEIVVSCDLSYEKQSKYVLCRVEKFTEYCKSFDMPKVSRKLKIA